MVDNKRKASLETLPPEIVFRIVEWVSRIGAEEERQREERRLQLEDDAMAQHEAALQAAGVPAPGGLGGPPPFVMFPAPPFAGGPVPNNVGGHNQQPPNINGLMQQIFGGLAGNNGQQQQQQPQPEGNHDANAGPALNNPPPNPFAFAMNDPANGQGPAGPLFGLQAMFQAMAGGIPPNNAAGGDESNDDAMSPLEPLPGHEEPPTNASEPARSAVTIAGVTSNGSTHDETPEMETLLDPGQGAAIHNAGSTSHQTQQSTVILEDGDEDASPAASTSAGPPLPNSATAILEPIETNTAAPLQIAVTPDQEATAWHSPELPLALQQEMALHQAVSFTDAELEEIPDMNEDSSRDEDQEDEAEGEGDPISDDHDEAWVDDDEDGDDDDNDEADEDEVFSEIDDDLLADIPDRSLKPQLFEDGLPKDPILPLAFVNRSFLMAVRSLLYSRQITLKDMYQLSLFLRSLQNPIVPTQDTEPEADDDEAQQRKSLPWLVRNVAVDVKKMISLGRGGGSMILAVVRLCTRLQGFFCTCNFLKSALPQLQVALKGCSDLKAFGFRGSNGDKGGLTWTMQNIEGWLTNFEHLDDLQLTWLRTSSAMLKPLVGKLKKLSLSHCDITDSDLNYLLKNSKGILEVLELHEPSEKMTRLGLAKAIIAHGSKLQILQLDVTATWYPTHAVMPSALSANLSPEFAAASRYFIDGLIGHMPDLLELKLSGNLSSTVLLARLPKNLEVLALEDNDGIEVPKMIQMLKKQRKVTVENPAPGASSTESVPYLLPKLRCFTVAKRNGMHLAHDLEAQIAYVMRQRKACVHWSYIGPGGPAAVWPGGDEHEGHQHGFHMVAGQLEFGPDNPLPPEMLQMFMGGAPPAMF